MTRHCDACMHAGLDHLTTARRARGWVTIYRCPACGWRHTHDHSPMVSAALDEAQRALDGGTLALGTLGAD
jgi:hypothetical protein